MFLLARHDFRALPSARFGERHVDGHLVAVEVGVECGTHERVELDSVAFDEYRPECLDALAVQGRRAVQEHVLVFDHFFENRPHFRHAVFDEAARAADVVGELALEQSCDDERAEELERHVLGQTALIELEFRTDDDDRAARVVDALAEQVLAEVARACPSDFGERFERAALRSRERRRACRRRWRMELSMSASTASCKMRFSLRRMTSGAWISRKFLQTVVAVDDAAIEVVDVGRRVAAAFERDHRAERRRDDRNAREEHPLRADVCTASIPARARGACASFSRSAAPAFS